MPRVQPGGGMGTLGIDSYINYTGIEMMLAQSPLGLGWVELIENHLFFARLASEEFVSSASNVTCLFLNITYNLC